MPMTAKVTRTVKKVEDHNNDTKWMPIHRLEIYEDNALVKSYDTPNHVISTMNINGKIYSKDESPNLYGSPDEAIGSINRQKTDFVVDTISRRYGIPVKDITVAEKDQVCP